MFRVTRYPMISKTDSGRVVYRKKYRVAGRVRVPAGHWLCVACQAPLKVDCEPLEMFSPPHLSHTWGTPLRAIFSATPDKGFAEKWAKMKMVIKVGTKFAISGIDGIKVEEQKDDNDKPFSRFDQGWRT